jgi:hypothetical protein
MLIATTVRRDCGGDFLGGSSAPSLDAKNIAGEAGTRNVARGVHDPPRLKRNLSG